MADEPGALLKRAAPIFLEPERAHQETLVRVEGKIDRLLDVMVKLLEALDEVEPPDEEEAQHTLDGDEAGKGRDQTQSLG